MFKALSKTDIPEIPQVQYLSSEKNQQDSNNTGNLPQASVRKTNRARRHKGYLTTRYRDIEKMGINRAKYAN